MTTPDTPLVTAARAGDTAAFGQLVVRHQAGALAYATAVLGDVAAAQDAVQDAFVDAFLHLHQLVTPAAFPAWLRRVVFKHCDRQRRRRVLAPLDHDAASPTAGPDVVLGTRRAHDAALAAVEALPEHERFVVALHYLAGLPVKDVAAFLSLEVSTVKKRLFTARGRLAVLGGTMTETLLPPPRVAPRVALFLALRAGDTHTLRTLLDADPTLLDAREAWSDTEALHGGFTLAHGLTPLLLAASLGDAAAVDLLLDRGAAVDGTCGCDNHETALWAAARAGHTGVVARLLAAGADPDAANLGGRTALDLAHWRGDTALVDLLAGAGAHRTVTLPPAPSAFTVTDAGGVHTGLKAIDLWAPLREGDVVRVHGAAETGLTVLLTEITAWAAAAGGAVVWTSWARHPWHRRELHTVAARGGADRAVHLVVDDRDAPHADLLDHALEVVGQLRATHPLTVHVIFEQEGHATQVAAAFPRLGAAATLTFVVRPWAAVTRGDLAAPQAGGAHDAVIVTDPRLAALGVWPAIDPLATRTRRPDPPRTAAARDAVAALADVDPTLAEGGDVGARGRRLLALTAQPFVSAWPDTGWPGVAVPAETLHADVDAVLAGAWDHVDATTLRYRAALGAPPGVDGDPLG